jgi:hypothetical protein
MAALGRAFVGHPAHRAPMPFPVPTKVSDLMLPPPVPPPQGLPPVENRPPADAGDGAFTIQTVAAAAGLPPVPTPADGNGNSNGNGVTIVQVTMTSSTPTPEPTGPGSSVSQKEGDKKGPGHPDSSGDCRLMGPFAIFVQLGLGGLALMSLVYKRWRERPQRPVKIWFFDASKQVFGSVLVHMANVFMSLLTSGRFSIKVTPGVVSSAAMLLRRDGDSGSEPYTPNPCSFYLLNLAIDVSRGCSCLPYPCPTPN